VPAAHAPVSEDHQRRGVLDHEGHADRNALDGLVVDELDREHAQQAEEPEQREVSAADRAEVVALEDQRDRGEGDEREQDPPLGQQVGRYAELEGALGDDATDRVERGRDDREDIAQKTGSSGRSAQSASQSRG